MTTAKKLTPAPDVKIDEIEWRVDSKPSFRKDNSSAARWVPYVNAPIVAGLLDDWVGPENWHDEYELTRIGDKEVMWCHLSVRAAGGEWVVKSDVGTASNMEAQKGLVSDAFKRAACLKWGVARNVYKLPTLWAPCRVYGQGDRQQAAECPETIPSLIAQLKKLGFDAKTVRATDGESTEAGGDPSTQTRQPSASDAPDGGGAGGSAREASGVTGDPVPTPSTKAPDGAGEALTPPASPDASGETTGAATEPAPSEDPAAKKRKLEVIGACKAAGLVDDQRKQLLHFISRGRTSTSADVTDAEVAAMTKVAPRIKKGDLTLAEGANGWVLVTKDGQVATGSQVPDVEKLDDDEAWWKKDRWTAFIKEHGVTQPRALRQVKAIAEGLNITPVPRELGDWAHGEISVRLRAWVEAQKQDVAA